MTPRMLILIVAVIILLFAFLHPTNLAEPEPEQVVKQAQVWPTIVADPNPAYARLAFIAALRPKPHPLKRPTVRAASAGAPVVTESSVNGYPCGAVNDLPPCWVMRRESGGNPTAQNPRSTASGLWQVLDSTWRGYAGYAKARLAPAEVQTEFARLLWNHGAGCSHWASCA